MPIDQLQIDLPNDSTKLYDIAVELGGMRIFLNSGALALTKRLLLQKFTTLSNTELINEEAIIDAFINYRVQPNNFRQLETKSILGNALILRAISSDAVNIIGTAYIEWGRHATELCTAMLLWTGDNPELAEVEDKILLNPDVVESLLFYASGRLTQRIRVLNQGVELRKRLSAEIHSYCEIPESIKAALDQDKHIFGGTLTNQKLLSELQFIACHVEEGDVKNRVDSLLLSLATTMNEQYYQAINQGID